MTLRISQENINLYVCNDTNYSIIIDKKKGTKNDNTD